MCILSILMYTYITYDLYRYKWRNQYFILKLLFFINGTCFFLHRWDKWVCDWSQHIYRGKERENRLNHRADVGDVFCHSLTRGEEISLAHIHKKRFLSLSPSFSGHCRRRRREIATSSFVILSVHRSSREKEKSRTYPNDWMKSVFWPEYIYSFYSQHMHFFQLKKNNVYICYILV